MNRLLSIFLAITIINVGCNSSKVNNMNTPVNQLTQKEINTGWQLLFDGESTKGWHTYGKESVGKVWTISDGTLQFDPTAKQQFPNDGGDLVTDGEYDNFHLKLEWKISPKGNSGVIFYINEDAKKYPNTYLTGIEMQVLDNGTSTVPGHNDAKIYTHRAGDLYDLIAADEVVNPQGEWNLAEIKSLNGQLDFYLNGKHTLSTKLWDENWNKMVAISKFKDWADFGKFKKGKIALQDHGDLVWYRNIRIKQL